MKKMRDISIPTSILMLGIYAVIGCVATIAWAPFLWGLALVMLIIGLLAIITAYANARADERNKQVYSDKADKLRHICDVEAYYTAQFSRND